MRHDFQGNVRELENLIEYGFVLCYDRLIDVHHLPEDLQPTNQSPTAAPAAPVVAERRKLQVAESDVIGTALQGNQGRVEETARELGISRTTLWRKMKKLGIDAREYQAD